MSLFTPSTTGSYRYGRFNGPLDFLEFVVERVLLVSCQNIVTLNADIYGDLINHDFYWEQTGGPPVIWLEPQNQPMVMYQKNPSQSDQDCFFRFWIDRYTPFRQFRDLVVSGSARDDLTLITNVNMLGTLGSPSVPNPFQISPDFTYAPDSTLDSNTAIFTFTIPNIPLPATITKNVVYTVENGVYIPYVELPFYGNLVTNVDLTKSYVVRTFFTLPGLINDQYYEGKIQKITIGDRPRTIDTGDICQNYSIYNVYGSVSVFQTTLIELSSELVEDTVDITNAVSAYGNITILQTQLVTLEQVPEIPEENALTINITNAVSRLSVFQVQLSDGITVIG